MIASKYRTVFTWGANPRDLDAHLVCILPDSTTRYHVFYGNKNAQDSTGNNIANLDVDITTGNGQETLTFDVEIENTYIYYVHWYAGEGTWSGSSAKVVLYRGAEEVGTYSVPNENRYGYNESWNVFKISNGILTRVGTVTTNPILSTNSSVSSSSIFRVSTSTTEDINVPIYYQPKNY